MGCDIDYFLDHDFVGLSAQEFLEEFKRRVAPLSVIFTGFAESPYARNDWNPNGWSLYCWEHDFETAFKKQEIDLLLSLNGKYIGWTIKLFNKAFCLEVFDDDLSFVLGRRWWQFREFYLEADDNESSERVNRTIEEIRSKMPELPEEKRQRYMGLGLSEYDACVIVEQMPLALFFDKVLELGANPKTAVNFIMGEIAAYLKENKIEITDTKLTPENLAELISLIEKGTISNNIGKQILVDEMIPTGEKASAIVEKKGLSQISDEGAIKEIVEKVVLSHPAEIESYRNGKTNLLGFFVGQVMKETKGRANPKTVNELIRKILEG